MWEGNGVVALEERIVWWYGWECDAMVAREEGTGVVALVERW